MKRLNFLIAALMLSLSTAQSHAAIVTLDVLDSNITVGENFDVAVRLDGEGIGEPLLAFGFDVFNPGGAFSYLGYTLGGGFFDASDPFNPNNVAGAGLEFADDLQLATLSFSADTAGTDSLTIEGAFDGLFYGLFYEISGFDIGASTDIMVVESPTIIPLPPAFGLFALGLLGLGFVKRSRRLAAAN